MSRIVGERLPEEVVRAFDGEDLEGKIGPAYLLVTTDSDGTPRPCMLSAGEILAVDDRRLRVALWPGTSTSQNLSRGGRFLFCYVAKDEALYVKGRSRPLPAAAPSKLQRFELSVELVESDLHGGMPVTSGIEFAVTSQEPAAVAASWREQVASLRED